jgi:hypothetical protein
MGGMRSALALLAVLVLSGCTSEAPVGAGTATPSGPCAKTREQPPEGSQEQRLQGDLDGDGRTDEVVSWLRDGERVAQAWLATGENAEPEPLFAGDLLAAADADDDGRAEVFAATAATTGGAYVLVGCRLEPVTLEGQPWTYPLADRVLVCRGGGVLDLLPGGERFRLSGGTVTAAGAAPALGAGQRAAGPVACG